MKKISVISGLLACCLAAGAQQHDQEPKPISAIPLDSILIEGTNEYAYTQAEEIAQFPGGMPALSRYLGGNIKYPREARNKNIQGKVVARFIILKDGSLTHFEIVKRVGGGCDEETLRVIKNMPRWIPARQNGQPISMWYTLPCSYRLAE